MDSFAFMELQKTVDALRSENAYLKAQIGKALELAESIEFEHVLDGVKRVFRPADYSPVVKEWKRIVGGSYEMQNVREGV